MHKLVVCILTFAILVCSITLITPILQYRGFVSNLQKIKYGNITICDWNDHPILHIDSKYSPLDFNAKIRVRDIQHFIKRIIRDGELALGEMYVEGLWTSPDIVELVQFLLANAKSLQEPSKIKAAKYIKDDRRNILYHYDVGNEFYQMFLDSTLMAYTCGIFTSPSDTLETSQYNKVNLIMKKLDPQPGETVLDLGCGWGKIGNYISTRTNSTIHGVTLSDAQALFIKENILPINPRFVLLHMNYKDVPDAIKYDKIYSIEMIEAVRCVNYRDTFMRKVSSLLKDNGRFVLQCITNSSNYNSNSTCKEQSQTFVSTHIFPGGQFVIREHLMDAAAYNGLKLVHMEVFGGQHYAKTLYAWNYNMLQQSHQEDTNSSLLKSYEYYFASMEACFSMDMANITHFVFEKIQGDLRATAYDYK
jgi:cyclopropane-fatty-acyl-phospholipid synthase